MFDEYDEEARRIVSEFCKCYDITPKLSPTGNLPEPKVWLMWQIAMSLKKAAEK